MAGDARAFIVVSMLALAGCGGGGGGGDAGLINPPAGGGGKGSVPYTAGVHQPWRSLAAQCAAPRSGTDPDGFPWPDVQGSVASENNFLRSWTNDLYLWYDEAPDLDPNDYPNVLTYFDLLQTSELTASGQEKDRFHFWYDTDEWLALSESGVSVGYGVQWMLIAASPPRQLIVVDAEPGTQAEIAGVLRGVEIIAIDSEPVIDGNADILNAGLFPAAAGESHTFTIRELSGQERPVTLTADEVVSTPVRNVGVIPNVPGPVGYILFNDHIATSEAGLVDAISTLQDEGVQDLVLDIRYNGGGYLDIASSLAYMIAGAQTSGRAFERLTFNDKHPATDPVTGQPLAPTPFHTVGNFGASDGVALPTLNLPRVYVLTGPNTCSASESIINGLRGVDVEVYQIGSTTCGKPYGFYPWDNCGTTYFSIQFQGNNEKGFGDYPDGFSPENTSGVEGVPVPGCPVADDFSHALGDPAEARLAAALAFRASNHQSCPTASGFAPGTQLKPGRPLSSADGKLLRSPLRENRILRGM